MEIFEKHGVYFSTYFCLYQLWCSPYNSATSIWIMFHHELCYLVSWSTISCANIRKTQITRILIVISVSSIYCQYFITYLVQKYCSFLIISTCSPTTSQADNRQMFVALAVFCTLDWHRRFISFATFLSNSRLI